MSSLPEVLPDERALFDPWDIDDIAAHMEAALGDPAVAAALDDVREPALNWSVAADRVAEVYRSLRPRQPAPAGRRRLGVVTVLPPAPSGVADHSDRLIAALHSEVPDADVVVYANRSAESRPFPVRRTAALATDWAAGELDQIVFCVGNNRLHRDALTALRHTPGHVFLHDVRVPALDESMRPPALDQVVDSARSVIVQSAHAAELVRADFAGAEITDIGPHPCQVVADASHIADAGLPWVVSGGIAHEIKRSDVIGAAMAELVARGVIRAALVGAGGDRFAPGGVTATGGVDDHEFDRWLRRATVLVQLRRESNGESSGVVAHAMARGVPLIVSDLGAMSELPDEVAIKVPVEIDAAGLAHVIDELIANPARLAAMRAAGLEFAAHETPAAQARRLVDAVFG